MSLAINNDIDLPAPIASLHFLVLLRRYMCDSNIMCDVEPAV